MEHTTNKSPKEEVKSVLYIETGLATWNQIHSIFTRAIKTSGIYCKFQMVMPKNREGKFKGFALIWFSDQQIPNLLMGNNPDGSERIEEREDPTWVPPEGDKEKIIDERTQDITSWAEISDIEEEVGAMFMAPKIRVKLPTLLPIPKYYYNREQKQILKKTGKGDLPKEGGINISYVTVRRHREGLSTHVIFGEVEEWMDTQKVKSIFSKYVTVPDGKYPMVKVLDRVNQRGKKMTFVTFSPNSMDGQTAAFMSHDFIYNDNQHGKIKMHFKHPKEQSKCRRASSNGYCQ